MLPTRGGLNSSNYIIPDDPHGMKRPKHFYTQVMGELQSKTSRPTQQQ